MGGTPTGNPSPILNVPRAYNTDTCLQVLGVLGRVNQLSNQQAVKEGPGLPKPKMKGPKPA